MKMALIEIFGSYYVNKMKRCLSSQWQISLLHYSVTFNISWRIESVNHLLDIKWQSFLNSKALSVKFLQGNRKTKKGKDQILP